MAQTDRCGWAPVSSYRICNTKSDKAQIQYLTEAEKTYLYP